VSGDIRQIRRDCEGDLRRCLAEQALCVESLRTGLCPPWHPKAGQPLSESDRREARRGLNDWVGEEMEILSQQDDYIRLIDRRKILSSSCGFEPALPMTEGLFDFQRDCVRWALRKGRAALFQDCGLGKTVEQLEWARHVCRHTGGNVLIFAPLAVAKQTEREGEKFGILVKACRTRDDCKSDIAVTNYEMLEHFDPESFAGIVLDESSCLKGHDRITRQRLTDFAAKIPFRLLCSATPAPNDHMELGTQAEFLGVMKRTEMLSEGYGQVAAKGPWREAVLGVGCIVGRLHAQSIRSRVRRQRLYPAAAELSSANGQGRMEIGVLVSSGSEDAVRA
jgi:hypothetical protein